VRAWEIGIGDVRAVMHKDLLRHYDVCFAVDADIHFRQGWVGQGKSSFLLLLLYMLNRRFWPLRDMVIKDDYHTAFRLLHRKYPLGVHAFDEYLPFFNRQVWSRPFIATTTVDFMLNRKDFKIWGGAVPSIWRLVPTFHENRLQMLFRVRNRTEVEVYEHSGKCDQAEDWWGKYITTIERVPFVGDVFPKIWSLYEWMNDGHPRIHRPEFGCVEGLMGMPAVKVWPIIERYWAEVQDSPAQENPQKVDAFVQGPAKRARRRRQEEKGTAVKYSPRNEGGEKGATNPNFYARSPEGATTYPLLMNRKREDVV